MIITWLFNALGINNSFTHTGTLMYNFFSGVGLTAFWPIIWWRHHNCHVATCLFVGHPDGNGVVYCRKHNQHKKEK